MSVVLRPTTAKIRNEGGEFQGFNVMADNTVEETLKSIPKTYTALNNKVDELEGEVDTLNSGGLIMKDSVIATNVKDWLDEHPEATTSVQDGSLTEAKFTDALKLATIKDYVTPEMFGAKGDGITDDTQAIQSALSSGQNVLINGDYLVAVSKDDETALSINVNNIDVTINGTITLETNEFDAYRILSLNDVENVHIHGTGKIVGDKASHTATTGEWGHCLALYGCKDVLIDGLRLMLGWGDGIYIKESENNSPSNIEIINVICNNNRRNGLSLICGEKIRIINSVFSNTSGVAPEAGLDIEPNSAAETIDVYIDGCIFIDNKKSGLSCVNPFNSNKFDVTVGSIKLIDNRLYISSGTANFNFNASSITHFINKAISDGVVENITLYSGNVCFIGDFAFYGGSYTTGSTYFLYSGSSNAEKPHIEMLMISADDFGSLCGNGNNNKLSIGAFVNKIRTVTSNNVFNADLTVEKIVSEPVVYGVDTTHMYTTKLVIPSDSTHTGTINIPSLGQLYDGFEMFVVNLSSNQVKPYSYQSTHKLPDGTTGDIIVAAGKMAKLRFCKDNNTMFAEYII